MPENNILNQLRNIENPFQCHSDVFNETHSFKLYQELINLYIEDEIISINSNNVSSNNKFKYEYYLKEIDFNKFENFNKFKDRVSTLDIYDPSSFRAVNIIFRLSKIKLINKIDGIYNLYDYFTDEHIKTKYYLDHKIIYKLNDIFNFTCISLYNNGTIESIIVFIIPFDQVY
jgi:hypothetical protein